ncbi:MAG: hypothetical protein WA771_11865, partial [Chthoniobacterales bacterium]
ARDHATLSEGIRSYRQSMEQVQERMAERQKRIDDLRGELEATKRASRAKEKELRVAAADEERLKGEYAEKLRATRERLGSYRKVFGGLERLGLFK